MFGTAVLANPIFFMEMKPELTICSVCYSPANKALLEVNWFWVNKLNTAKNWLWLLADNAPTESPIGLDKEKFLVVPGAQAGDLPDFIRPWMRGSYHHTLAINNSLKYIKTRFAVFLDSDFYIVRPEWTTEVISHMKSNGLVFFGVPWHPKHIKKYRYFPAIHALFVDFSKINKEDLDFLPQYEELFKSSVRIRFSKLIKKIFFKVFFRSRRDIGASRDSGYAIFRRYAGNKKFKFECPKPVFSPRRDLKKYPAAASRANRILEKFLPERLCFIPKRKDYYAETGFSELGRFDASGAGWEEFIWKGEPFGFHLRGSYRRGGDLERDIALVAKAFK